MVEVYVLGCVRGVWTYEACGYEFEDSISFSTPLEPIALASGAYGLGIVVHGDRAGECLFPIRAQVHSAPRSIFISDP